MRKSPQKPVQTQYQRPGIHIYESIDSDSDSDEITIRHHWESCESSGHETFPNNSCRWPSITSITSSGGPMSRWSSTNLSVMTNSQKRMLPNVSSHHASRLSLAFPPRSETGGIPARLTSMDQLAARQRSSKLSALQLSKLIEFQKSILRFQFYKGRALDRELSKHPLQYNNSYDDFAKANSNNTRTLRNRNEIKRELVDLEQLIVYYERILVLQEQQGKLHFIQRYLVKKLSDAKTCRMAAEARKGVRLCNPFVLMRKSTSLLCLPTTATANAEIKPISACSAGCGIATSILFGVARIEPPLDANVEERLTGKSKRAKAMQIGYLEKAAKLLPSQKDKRTLDAPSGYVSSRQSAFDYSSDEETVI